MPVLAGEVCGFEKFRLNIRQSIDREMAVCMVQKHTTSLTNIPSGSLDRAKCSSSMYFHLPFPNHAPEALVAIEAEGTCVYWTEARSFKRSFY